MAVFLLSRVGVGWVVITRFNARTQFKLDLTGTGTGTELGNRLVLFILFVSAQPKLLDSVFQNGNLSCY